MKRDRTYEELLSAYIDGELESEQVRFVEEELLGDSEWKKRYEEMRVLRTRMMSLPEGEKRKALWPALSSKIEEEEYAANSNIFPAKLMPVATVLLVIVVGLSSFYITRNWDTVSAYFDDTRTVVGDIYEQGIVRGALQPLFDGVTNDDMIRFAVSGILSIPEADGHGLKVESDGDQQYDLEFADAGRAREAPSLSELYAHLEVTEGQIHAIDSVLTGYRDIVRSSAFIADDEEIVISPELAGLDKFIIASVAEQLKPAQRLKLNTVLNRFNPELHIPEEGRFPHLASAAGARGAPFQIQVTPSPDGRVEVRAEVRGQEQTDTETEKRSQNRSFIIVRPDTVISKEIHIPDFSQFKDQIVDAEQIRRTVGEALASRLHNTRIQFQANGESPHIQVFTHLDRPGIAGQSIKLDSMALPHFQEDHFKQLRELSKIMQRRSSILREQLPSYTGGDTVRIPHEYYQFDEVFEQNMEQLEFDLNRLKEELEKVLDDPEQLMFSPDSVYFHLFPDTTEN